MAKDMKLVLQGRMKQIEDFDFSFKAKLQTVKETVAGLGLTIDADKVSADKSVRAYIRQRTNKVNHLVEKFQNDLNAILASLPADEPVKEVTEETASETSEETKA